ncbi:uncharacterized protein LOC124132032 [Haliotis rufescens]|uniref:uncharacterized protein LOC124132032 n=1 Tax=Haliotis rufescens TaxID=6454 RepID=UPI00201F6738|nr:uncharacterized protein LOC124132032 [Haliotis rufescens]XP_046351567.2 uncharacterized protein LOC124132032 [Haliotis rufescens]XP_046351568.2 uncharacterized protein LOC124132032 [Haliotis rufescens]
MACGTDFRVDVNACLLDWQQPIDCLPQLTQTGPIKAPLTKAEGRPQHAEKVTSKKVFPKPKISKKKTGNEYSDLRPLINEDTDELQDSDAHLVDCSTGDDGATRHIAQDSALTAGLDRTCEGDSRGTTQCEEDHAVGKACLTRKLYKKETEIDYSDVKPLIDEDTERLPGQQLVDFSVSDDDTTSLLAHSNSLTVYYNMIMASTRKVATYSRDEDRYITATEAHAQEVPRDTISLRLDKAQTDIEQSMDQAMTVLLNKKKLLLGRLHTLRVRREEEQKERDKAKVKTPIRVIKSPRASPGPNPDSDPEQDSVFTRKMVIKTDKRKNELKLLDQIEDIVTKAEMISQAAKGVNYMAPFLEATVLADVDGDEESSDLVDVQVVHDGGDTFILATDFKNSCLKSFSISLEAASRGVLKFDSSPWGISQVKSNMAAVSVPLSNKVCFVELIPHLKLKETVRTKKQYYGLVSVGSRFLVATSPYSNPRSVDIIANTGHILHTLTVDTLMQQPSFICLTPKGSFIVSDLSKGAVLILSHKLEFQSGLELGNKAHMQSSRGVTTNKEGDVFVVDYNQKKVKVFSSEGHFLKDLLTSEDGLKYPYGVCFDDHGRICVTDGGKIKIFSY